MTEKIRFLHIPKTAGSSFDECLFIVHLRAYLLRRRFTFSGDLQLDQRRYRDLSSRERRRIVICTGHAPRVTGCADFDRFATITMLRNPLDRVKSFCQHVSEGKSPLIHRQQARPFDLDEFLGSGRMQLANFQSRMLLGEQGYDLPAGDTEALAQRAARLLATDFACFGITEEFDRSLLLFRQVLGWRKWPIYRLRNRPNPQALLEFEQRHIQRIEELNRIDLRLYELAAEIFHRLLAEHCPQLELELAQFRSLLARPHAIFPAMDAARAIAGGKRKLQGRQGASKIRAGN